MTLVEWERGSLGKQKHLGFFLAKTNFIMCDSLVLFSVFSQYILSSPSSHMTPLVVSSVNGEDNITEQVSLFLQNTLVFLIPLCITFIIFILALFVCINRLRFPYRLFPTLVLLNIFTIRVVPIRVRRRRVYATKYVLRIHKLLICWIARTKCWRRYRHVV